MTILLIFISALLTVCIGAPTIVAKRFGTEWVVVAAVLAFIPWRYCGPRPSPGFLDGIICISGYTAIAATVFTLTALAIRG